MSVELPFNGPRSLGVFYDVRKKPELHNFEAITQYIEG